MTPLLEKTETPHAAAKLFGSDTSMIQTPLLLSLLIASCLIEPSYAVPIFLPPQDADGASHPTNAITLYLDITLNGVPRGLLPVEQQGDALLITPAIGHKIGLKLNESDTERIDLLTMADVTANYDQAMQTLSLTTAMANTTLPTTYLSNRDSTVYAASGDNGALFNYELYTGHSADGQYSASLLNEFRFFSHASTFSNTAITSIDSMAQGHAETIRLDTTFTHSWQDPLITLKAGDNITRPLTWSRAIRYGGLHIGHDFELNPNMIRSPLTEFVGSTTVPSNVDLLINGINQFNADIPPGPFTINIAPSINGYGVARMVTTDLLGQTQEIELPLFATPDMLQPGLWDWGFDIGKARMDYGVRSFNYDAAIITNSVSRYGLHDRLTLENQIETAPDFIKTGIGFLAQPWSTWGKVSGSYAYSQRDKTVGNQWSLGYRWNNSTFSFGAFTLQSNDTYHDLASLYDANTLMRSNRAFVGFNTERFGHVALSYLDQKTRQTASDPAANLDAENLKIVNASWGLSLPKNITLNVSASQHLADDRHQNIFITLNKTLDNRVHLFADMSPSFKVGASQGSDSSTGLDWAVTAAEETATMEGKVNYRGNYGAIGLQADNKHNVFANASGSALFMGGHAFLSPSLSESFALVSTNGIPNVPIHLENQLVGHTDASGLLVVTPLHAYQKNKITFDGLAIPAHYQLGDVTAYPVPTRQAGILVPFAIEPLQAALFQIVDETNQALPLGSTVFVFGESQPYTMGFDGFVYIDHLKESQTIEVHLPKEAGMYEAAKCQASITYTPKTALGQTPTIICQPIHPFQ
jgi:outer membrane usher protein